MLSDYKQVANNTLFATIMQVLIIKKPIIKKVLYIKQTYS